MQITVCTSFSIIISTEGCRQQKIEILAGRQLMSAEDSSMSASGLGRVKTPLRGDVDREPGAEGQATNAARLDPNDVHYPGQITGEDRKGHH
jgi:hypothetical protein